MSAINDEHEQYNNLVFDLINTLRDCKATPSLLIDDAFNVQFDKLLRNIDENRRDDKFYSAATEEYRENLRAVVDGFSEKFPGSRVSDEVSVDDFA
jgi:deoxyadenosine/deoxycytidine kinase